LARPRRGDRRGRARWTPVRAASAPGGPRPAPRLPRADRARRHDRGGCARDRRAEGGAGDRAWARGGPVAPAARAAVAAFVRRGRPHRSRPPHRVGGRPRWSRRRPAPAPRGARRAALRAEPLLPREPALLERGLPRSRTPARARRVGGGAAPPLVERDAPGRAAAVARVARP